LVFRDVKDSQWSADHIARHGVTLDEVREAILERPYWQAEGKDDTVLVYGRTYTGRYLFVVAADDGGEAFIDDAQREEDLPEEGTVMTMMKRDESLPRPAEDLEALAAYYDANDTSAEMEHGEWVDPRPMKTTSLRLPGDVVDALRVLAQTRGMRYTALVREIIEHALNGVRLAETESEELARINERLARIEAAVVAQPDGATRSRPAKKSSTSKSRDKVPALQERSRRKAPSAQSAGAKAASGSRRGSTGKG
jgi:predicted DNA-binding protein